MNRVLIENLKHLVKKERELLKEILNLLIKVEQKKIFLEMGYPSLFEFCTKELGYSHSAAGRRISAMKLMKAVPQVAQKIESGVLTLSTANQVQIAIQSKERQGSKVSQNEKNDLVKMVENKSQRESERILFSKVPQVISQKERTRVVTEELTEIRFTADTNFMKKLERLKALKSHSNPYASIKNLFEKLMDEEIEKLEKKKVRQHIALPAPVSKSKNVRYVPSRIKKYISNRDQNRCQYVDSLTGQKCESQWQLQYDHIQPISKGGDSTVENLNLLCRKHNAWKGQRVI